MMDIAIGTRRIGAGHPVLTIAEVGFNHGGDPGLGAEMVHVAARAGADAVKLQTFRATELTLKSWEHFDLVRHGEMGLDGHRILAAAAAEAGIALFSTPFSPWAVGVLEEIGVPAYKIASMDVTNLPLLREVARTGKPVLLSTGMATLAEIGAAVDALLGAGNGGLCLLHCVSHYPADPGDINLRTMEQLAETFGLPVGFSDHVLGNAVALAAVARGACVVEKHFTTDKGLPGPDHKLSADPEEFLALVEGIRAVEAALGRPAADEGRPDRANAALARRGLYAATSLAAGTVVTEDAVKCVRPERGFRPDDIGRIVGRRLAVDLAEEEPFTPDVF